jgi:three-Cys-motif partner protein
MGKQVALRCFFVESEKKPFERLDAFRRGNSDIEIRLAHSKFEAALPQIQSFIQEAPGKKFAFILVDPKGWDGFSMSAMAELLRLPFVEVVVNFMTSFIKRFLESPNELTQIQLEALFGDGSLRRVIEGLSGLEREYAAVDAYARNLAKVGDFGFVCKALVLNPEIDKTHYYLVYVTRNSRGVEVFKKAESKAMKEQYGNLAADMRLTVMSKAEIEIAMSRAGRAPTNVPNRHRFADSLAFIYSVLLGWALLQAFAHC